MDNFENEIEEAIDTTPDDCAYGPSAAAEESFGEFDTNMVSDIPTANAVQAKSHRILKGTVAAILAAALVGTSCGLTSTAVNRYWEQKTLLSSSTIDQLKREVDSLQASVKNAALRSNTQIIGTNLAYEGMMTPRQVYANNERSVVGISSKVQTVSFGGQTNKGTSTGSGFILTEDGYVVTNYHVVEGASEVTVVLNSKDEYDAKVIGYDSINDVAVLKIEASGLPAVTLGSSEDLFVGDYVVAIGNPLGALTATMTYGIVSGKNREVTTDNTTINMIQTDAAINAGNSGGPLFNMYGEVVGITTAKYSGTTSSGASIEGIGFAIPIDDVMSIIGDLRDFGYVTGAYLGVTVQDTDAAAASVYGLPTGAYVVTVVEGGSADRAGIQEKDIIIGLGDYEVSTVSELTRTLRRFKANDTTTITVIRAGERKTLTITLDEKPRDLNAPATEEQEPMPQSGTYDEWYKYFFGENGLMPNK